MSRNSGFLPWIGKIGPMEAEYIRRLPKTVGTHQSFLAVILDLAAR